MDKIDIDKVNEIMAIAYQLAEIPRTGYVKRHVQEDSIESIAGHSARCMQIATFMLPDKLTGKFEEQNSSEYSKFRIILLLAFHDVGEATVGDIVRGTKTEEQVNAEHMAVKKFTEELFSLPARSDWSPEDAFAVWEDMDTKNPKNINARIAKEIDYIQGSVRYFYYCIGNQVKFDNNDLLEWLNEVSDEKIKTKIGRHIRKKLIYDNADFEKLGLNEILARQPNNS